MQESGRIGGQPQITPMTPGTVTPETPLKVKSGGHDYTVKHEAQMPAVAPALTKQPIQEATIQWKAGPANPEGHSVSGAKHVNSAIASTIKEMITQQSQVEHSVQPELEVKPKSAERNHAEEALPTEIKQAHAEIQAQKNEIKEMGKTLMQNQTELLIGEVRLAMAENQGSANNLKELQEYVQTNTVILDQQMQTFSNASSELQTREQNYEKYVDLTMTKPAPDAEASHQAELKMLEQEIVSPGSSSITTPAIGAEQSISQASVAAQGAVTVPGAPGVNWVRL